MPRLDQLLARNLGDSRADARRRIDSGAVADRSGLVLQDPRLEIDSAALPLAVRVGALEVTLHGHAHVLLNKPAGYVTALKDARHPAAYDLLHGAPLLTELRAVGRLDLDTTGVLLWTTDSAWLQWLTHPRRRVPRTYQAALARPFNAVDTALTLEDGYQPQIAHMASLNEESLHPALLKPGDAAVFATITILGGAYHEVRRIFAALGSHVLALCRVQFGNMTLPVDLPAGAFRAVNMEDVWPGPIQRSAAS